MSGMRDRTGVYVLKKALFDLATELYADEHPEFLQSWGEVVRRPDEYAQWMDGFSRQESAALSPNRPRDETVTVAVEMFCLRRGEVDAAREAEEYIFDRLGELERHVRYTDPTLGGVALSCFLESVSNDTADLAAIQASGRLAALRAEFTARIRITG